MRTTTDSGAITVAIETSLATSKSLAFESLEVSLKNIAKNELLQSVEVGFKATAIGRMEDLKIFLNDPLVDTWAKSGLKNQRVTWAQNKAWIDERIMRGDKFYLTTDPKTLPKVKGGYVEGTPNGYFTARELEYLNSKGIKPIAKYKWKEN